MDLRGIYLGLNIALRAIGLPFLGPLRAVFTACWFVGKKATELVADTAVKVGLPQVLVDLLKRFRDRGLPGLNRRLDYRRCEDACYSAGTWLIKPSALVLAHYQTRKNGLLACLSASRAFHESLAEFPFTLSSDYIGPGNVDWPFFLLAIKFRDGSQ